METPTQRSLSRSQRQTANNEKFRKLLQTRDRGVQLACEILIEAEAHLADQLVTQDGDELVRKQGAARFIRQMIRELMSDPKTPAE